MNRIYKRTLLITVAATCAATIAGAAKIPNGALSLDQKVEQATLRKYHHTDQGTRILPAAFLQALKTADGKSKLMSPENLRGWGFIIEDASKNATNPFGWPLGFTVSNPAVSNGIPVAGSPAQLVIQVNSIIMAYRS